MSVREVDMAEEEAPKKSPMKISRMLKFVNIWMDDDLKRWTESYSGKLLADVGLKPETQEVTELSMFNEEDYHHLKSPVTLCKIKQRNIDNGLLDKWYAKAKANAGGDEAKIAEIEKDYQETLSGQAEKSAKYTWVLDCYTHQKNLRLAEKARKDAFKGEKDPDEGLEELNNIVEKERKKQEYRKKKGFVNKGDEKDYDDDFVLKKLPTAAARSGKATASRLAAVRKKLAA